MISSASKTKPPSSLHISIKTLNDFYPSKQKPPENSLAKISAKQYMLYDIHGKNTIYKKLDKFKSEIASLTKIMTAITARHLIKKFDISLDALVKVPPQAAGIIGTSAKLEEYMVLKLRDLFYGLMLPSGNDAAMVIAAYVGSFLKKSPK